MHNSESVLENVTHKLHWDFNIQTDHLISARRLHLIIINKRKRTCRMVNFPVLADYRVKLKESEKEDKYHDLVKELRKKKTKKTVEHESDDYINCNRCSWYSHQRIDTRIGGLGNKKTSEDHSNCRIIEIGQNTEKSPGNLRRLAVTQTPVKDHHLTLMWKTFKEQQ